ncbi:hypothetical protein VD0004_g9045 [Verticillium dahliae]|nr:hypothetical protein VD0004_g9045 [Verticillium dahliae]PNH63628.1 hypothetical protein VD0001_g9087 [Verticillium dahliae]
MKLSVLVPIFALGVSSVSANNCNQAKVTPTPRSTTGFNFFSTGSETWEWRSRDRGSAVIVNQKCELRQGAGKTTIATVCIDYSGQYKCWIAPAVNDRCSLPGYVCNAIANMWGW